MKISTRYIALSLIAVGLALALPACRTKKNAAAKPRTEAIPSMPGNVFEPSEALASLTSTYRTWNDVTLPVKLQLNSPSRFSISGQAKIINGKAILLSLRMLGFEVASVYADDDSIVAVSKIKGVYFSEPVSRLTARYGFSLSDIQALLLGRPFTPGKGTIRPSDINDYVIESMAETFRGNDYAFSFQPKKMPEWVNWMFVAGGKADNEPSLLGLAIAPDGLKSIDCIYGEAVKTTAGTFSQSMRIGTTFKEKELDAMISWTFDRAQWNSGLTLTAPKIPSGCRRVTTEQLLKMLGTK